MEPLFSDDAMQFIVSLSYWHMKMKAISLLCELKTSSALARQCLHFTLIHILYIVLLNYLFGFWTHRLWH